MTMTKYLSVLGLNSATNKLEPIRTVSFLQHQKSTLKNVYKT